MHFNSSNRNLLVVSISLILTAVLRPSASQACSITDIPFGTLYNYQLKHEGNMPSEGEIQQMCATIKGGRNPSTANSGSSNASANSATGGCQPRVYDVAKTANAISSRISSSGLVDEDYGNDDRFRANPYGNSADAIAIADSDPQGAKKILDGWKSIYDWQVKNKGKFDGYFFFYRNDFEPLIDSAKDRRLTAQAAWMVMAINRYRAKTGDTSFDKMRNDLIDWMKARNHNSEGGISMGEGTYNGDIGYGEKTKSTLYYDQVFATEHNIDMYAALKSSNRKGDQEEAAKLLAYLMRRFDTKTNMFDGGFNTATERPLDAQTWLILSLDESDRIKNIEKLNLALDNVLKKYVTQGTYDGKSVSGVHSGNGDVRGVWAEGTFGLIEALRAMARANEKAGQSNKAKLYRAQADQYEKEMLKLQNESGLYIYDTSAVWSKSGKPFEHMSGTAWSIMANQGVNPFNPKESLDRPAPNSIRIECSSGSSASNKPGDKVQPE